MKIALIGYGKMGHIVEEQALKRGHEISVIIDKDNQQDFNSAAFANADVAIEFSTPDTAVSNIRAAWQHHVPVVCGTTGWTERTGENGEKMLHVLQAEARENGLFWTSNYSIGMNLFMALNRYLAELMRPQTEYSVTIEETHHIHKKDAPSGTAVTLAQDIEKVLNAGHDTESHVEITSKREGEVPGIHTVCYDSAADCIRITHEAKSREGFALGAVLAAEFMQGRKGFYNMQDLLHL